MIIKYQYIFEELNRIFDEYIYFQIKYSIRIIFTKLNRIFDEYFFFSNGISEIRIKILIDKYILYFIRIYQGYLVQIIDLIFVFCF